MTIRMPVPLRSDDEQAEIRRFRILAETAYGTQFRRPLAHDMGIKVETVRGWLDGTRALPDWAFGRLAQCVCRVAERRAAEARAELAAAETLKASVAGIV